MKKCIFLSLVISFGLILVGCTNMKDNLTQIKTKVEINTNINSNEIFKAKNGYSFTITNNIKTSKLGNKKLHVQIQKEKKKESFEYNIKIVDTIKPIISAKSKTVFIGDKFDLMDGVGCTDNSKENIKPTIDKNGFNMKNAGIYNIVYHAKDSSGNKTTLSRKIIVRKTYSLKELKALIQQYIYENNLQSFYDVSQDKYDDSIAITPKDTQGMVINKDSYSTINMSVMSITKHKYGYLLAFGNAIKYVAQNDYIYIDEGYIRSSKGKMKLSMSSDQNTEEPYKDMYTTTITNVFANRKQSDTQNDKEELNKFEKIINGKNISMRLDDEAEYHRFIKPNKETIKNMRTIIKIYKYTRQFIQ